MMVPPVASSQAWATASGLGAAPHTAILQEDRVAPVARARVTRRSNMTGTPGKKVAGRRFQAASTRSAPNLGSTTWVAASPTAHSSDRDMPKAWKKGRTA